MKSKTISVSDKIAERHEIQRPDGSWYLKAPFKAKVKRPKKAQ